MCLRIICSTPPIKKNRYHREAMITAERENLDCVHLFSSKYIFLDFKNRIIVLIF